MSELGSHENPFTIAPDDWKSNGVPYGALCKCNKCGLVARSTYCFDYFATDAGVPLSCERCYLGQVFNADVANVQELSTQGR